MPPSGLGRPKEVEKYSSIHEYLNKYVLVIKDSLFALKEDELKKRKIHDAAVNKVSIQEDKLEKAYEGFEKFRK